MKMELPSDPFAGWPPVIDSAVVPYVVKLRDLVLTLLMWGVMLVILATEIDAALDAVEVLLGRSDAQINAELAEFFEKLKPLMGVIALLVIGLSAATVRSKRRRLDALSATQPEPLEGTVLAELAGLSLDELEIVRTHRVAVVHQGDDKKLSAIRGQKL
ncbi:hypothetical protein SOQ14_13540 [Erythrobacter sp. T5W1-R]|uniref:hypothetical protein n=1 Tax=Erythrobacter sp. T5W1-R TaxID=3101752 RepID=UPI002AFED42A|nr:hypothetical protein [Erythrobacter sp. T5W1-R]MEA1619941.1 hypothetical protein [Erythrobacter sp. T5W1-R]